MFLLGCTNLVGAVNDLMSLFSHNVVANELIFALKAPLLIAGGSSHLNVLYDSLCFLFASCFPKQNKQLQYKHCRIEGTPLVDHGTKLPSRSIRYGFAWGYAGVCVVVHLVLLGVLGHFETDPSSVHISDQLFMTSMAVVAIGVAITWASVLFFGFQFLGVISQALEEMEKQPTQADGAIQIKLIMSKVPSHSATLPRAQLSFITLCYAFILPF